MYSRIEKQFTNAATTPILITMSFELNDDKIIERIDAAGGTVPSNDVAKAEQQRMVRWVRDTFIGQHEFFLNAHNGNVPAPGFTETSGGEYEWAFTTPSAWNEMFAPTTADKVPGLTPYSAQRVSLDALQPIHYALDPEGAEKLLHDFHEAHPEIGDFFRQFLDNVPFSGSEQPPQPGERYYSYISNKTYTVVDARRKLHSQDYYITMDRDEDGHRTKFTYRNHAEWLTVWRPVDDEGNPRKVVEVDIEQQPSRMHRPGLRPNEIPTILTPGAWDAARVRREQDTMRELLRHYALLFVRHHGRATLKRLLAELDAETLLGLPHEHFMLLVTRCEAYSDRQGG